MIKIDHINYAAIGWNAVYAHGELERCIGYDLIGANVPINKGVHIADYKGQAVMIFVWENEFHRSHGLAVFTNDRESMEYATECFQTSKPNL